jgi:hypothetical protein
MSFYVIFIKMGWNIGTTQAIFLKHPRSWCCYRRLTTSLEPRSKYPDHGNGVSSVCPKTLSNNFTLTSPFFIPDAGNWMNQPATLCNTDKKA